MNRMLSPATLLLFSLLIAFTGSRLAYAQWEQRGLSDVDVTQLAVQDEFILAATSDGLYRQPLDAADTSWTQLAFAGARVFAVGASAADTLLAAIENEVDEQPRSEFYRSTDGGDSWEALASEVEGEALDFEIEAIARYPEGSETYFASGPAVILKTENAGESWQVVWGGLDQLGMGMHEVSFDPHRPDVVWGGGERATFQPFLVRSTNAGETFSAIPLDLGGDNAVYSVVVDPDRQDVVYAGTEGYVLRSSGEDDDWEEVLAPDAHPYFFGLAASAQHERRLYAAGWRRVEEQDLIIYISPDGGDSWVQDSLGVMGNFGVVDLANSAVNGMDRLLLATEAEGVFAYTAPVSVAREEAEDVQPGRHLLHQNYPNPFNTTTSLSFELGAPEHVELAVFDLTGRKVAVLSSGLREAGRHQVKWDASGLASGIYLYKLEAGSYREMLPMMLLK